MQQLYQLYIYSIHRHAKQKLHGSTPVSWQRSYRHPHPCRADAPAMTSSLSGTTISWACLHRPNRRWRCCANRSAACEPEPDYRGTNVEPTRRHTSTDLAADAGLTPSALLPVKKAHEQPEAAARDGLDGCLSER